jgi:uncharacterized protein YjbI with pentapeptide repeats
MGRKGTVGIMTTTYGHSREDVRHWPDDPAVRRTLEEYFDNFPPDSQTLKTILDAEGLDFTGADLSGLDLSEAILSEANLSAVRLAGADLYSAWLIGAVLRGADLSGCYLRKVQGRGCDAQDAILRGADLQRSEFERADFRRADFREARFGKSLYTGADFRGADLRHCLFGESGSRTGLTQARLANCRVEGARGTVSSPADVGVDSPELLDGADLQRWFADRGAPLVEVWQPA